MATQRQIEANRRNNPIKYGFTADRFLIDHEDAVEFNEFREGFFAEHQPETPTQTFLVEQMIAAAWRIRRIRYAEAAYWNQKMSDMEGDLRDDYKVIEDRDHLAYAVAYRSNTSIDNLARYEARLEKAFYKALHELERLRKDNCGAGLQACGRSPEPPQIGFVSPKPKLVPKPPASSLLQHQVSPRERELAPDLVDHVQLAHIPPGREVL